MTLRAAGDASQSRSPYTGVTDADGRYFFNGIAPGGYTLEVERAGYLRKLYRASPHETFSAITVAAGQHLNRINMAFTRAVAISGRVLDEDGDPVANVTVQLVQHTPTRLSPFTAALPCLRMNPATTAFRISPRSVIT